MNRSSDEMYAAGDMPGLADQIDRYLASCEAQGLSPKTIDSYRSSIAVFREWAADEGIETEDDLDQEVVDRYKAWLYTKPNMRMGKDQGRPIGRFSVARYTRTLRQFINWRGLEGLKAKPPKLGKVVKDVLSREEQQRLEDACMNDRDRLMIKLMGRRALRNTEVTLLRPGDMLVVGRKNFLRVQGKGAGGQNEERMVPFNTPESRVLWRQLRHFVETRPDEAPETIFFSKNKVYNPSGRYEPLTASGVYQVVRDRVRVAKIRKPVYPHLLRHSVITYWRLERGIQDVQIKQVAGNFTALDNYTHPRQGESYAFHDDLD